MIKIVCYIFLIFISFIVTEGKLNTVNLTRLKRDNVCLSPGCQQAADLIRKNMNPRVNPCDDFYEFACGGFIAPNIMPLRRWGTGGFDILTYITLNQITHMLSENIHRNEIAPFQMAKLFFQDCMDEITLRAVGIAPIIDILVMNQLGDWPVLMADWDAFSFSWIETTKKAREVGFNFNYIMSLNIRLDRFTHGRRIVYVEPPEFGISADDLKEGKSNADVIAYYNVMMAAAKLFGVDERKADLELSDSLLFEIKLAQILPNKDEERRGLIIISISEAQKRFPSIQWKAFVQSMLNPSVSVSEKDKIIIKYPGFVSRLENVLKDTPKRVLANYVTWRMLFFLLKQYLTRNEPRWKTCVDLTVKKLNLAVASMYARKFVRKQTKQSVTEITSNVRDQLSEIIMNSTWLDERTRQKALNKAEAIKLNVAYHEIVSDDKELTKVYQDLKLIPGQFYKSLLSIGKLDIDFSISTLDQPVLRDDWLAYGDWLSTNAYYFLWENNIRIPVALLQEHIFKVDRPSYMNYGAVGSVIGHELLHAFDTLGRFFDENGNVKNWWTRRAELNYDKKVRCFIQQFDSYTFDGTNKHVNGELTLDENIADTEGLKAAYHAYEKWSLKFGHESKLPDLNFTPQQMFWISAANIWCSKYNADYFGNVLNDVHSPDKIRVIGPFSNLESFARDFNCAVGSRMNPKNKCSLWN